MLSQECQGGTQIGGGVLVIQSGGMILLAEFLALPGSDNRQMAIPGGIARQRLLQESVLQFVFTPAY